MLRNLLKVAVLGAAVSASMTPVHADQGRNHSNGQIVSDDVRSPEGSAKTSPDQMESNLRAMGLIIPVMRPDRGRKLFATKGCVICHSVNGVGGMHTPALDAGAMPLPMNPFEFAAKMWRGAEAMIALQRGDLGELITLNGQELADIIAFVHDEQEQKKFSESDIPRKILDIMSEVHGDTKENQDVD